MISKCFDNFIKHCVISFQKHYFVQHYSVRHLTNKHKTYLVQKPRILQTFIDIDYLLNYNELKLLQVLDNFGTFSPFSVLSFFFFVLRNSFIVSGVCNTSLYPPLILNTNLLLILSPLFIRGELGTSNIDCGDKISKKPRLCAFSSRK